MTEITSKYANFEDLREQAITLRREGLSLRQIRDRLHIHNNDILGRLIKGEPAPEWTKRPRTKDDLREKARELRSQGMTYDQIQVELGCSKSSISLWVRDLPKPEPRHTDAERKHNPKTTRRNTAETYRGCLIIYVTKSADLYRRVEGTWYGIVLGVARSVS
ncbi:hypothetical protein [Streptomyces sp. NPDC001880]